MIDDTGFQRECNGQWSTKQFNDTPEEVKKHVMEAIEHAFSDGYVIDFEIFVTPASV